MKKDNNQKVINESEEVLLELKDITKIYTRHKVLENVSFSIKRGEKVAVIGSNGSGKTTLVEIIANIRRPSSGQIKYNFLEKKTPYKKIGIQLQDTNYPNGFTVLSIVNFYSRISNYDNSEGTIDELLKTFFLYDLKAKDIYNLSYGQKQRLNTLISILSKPELLILDEIMNGLDIKAQIFISEFILTYIAKTKASLILISHNLGEVKLFCDRVIHLEFGKIKNDFLTEKLSETEIRNKIIENVEMTKEEINLQAFSNYDIAKEQLIKKVQPITSKLEQQIIELEEKALMTNDFWAIFSLEMTNFFTTYRWLFPMFFSIVILFVLSLFVPINWVLPGAISISILGTAFFSFGSTLHEIVHSSIFKRINSFSIKKWKFIISITIFNIIIMFITGLWVIFWGFIFDITIFHNFDYTWIANAALKGDIIWKATSWTGLFWGFIILSFLSLAIAFLFVSIFRSHQKYLLFSLIYFIIAIFFGSMFLPRTFVDGNSWASAFSYFIPHRYTSYWIADCFVTESTSLNIVTSLIAIIDGDPDTYWIFNFGIIPKEVYDRMFEIVYANLDSIHTQINNFIDTTLTEEMALNAINKICFDPNSLWYHVGSLTLNDIFINDVPLPYAPFADMTIRDLILEHSLALGLHLEGDSFTFIAGGFITFKLQITQLFNAVFVDWLSVDSITFANHMETLFPKLEIEIKLNLTTNQANLICYGLFYNLLYSLGISFPILPDPSLIDPLTFNTDNPIAFIIGETIRQRILLFLNNVYYSLIASIFNGDVWDWNPDGISNGYLQLPVYVTNVMIPEGWDNIVDFFVPIILTIAFDIFAAYRISRITT